MSKKIFNKYFLFFSILLIHSTLLQAQKGTVSPYSRYGIGELQFAGFVQQIGMGGLGNTLHASDRLNFVNPASYAFDTITTFEAGIKSEVTKLSSNATSQTTNGVSLSYLAFGFPVVKNSWGASFGVIPYSNVGYNIVDKQDDATLGEVDYTFAGEGGLNRFYIGNGFAPFANCLNNFRSSPKFKKLVAEKDTTQIRKTEKKLKAIKGLSIGVNASWLFGSLNNSRSVQFIESTNIFNTKIVNKTTLGDFYFNLGLLYTCDLKNDYTLDIGLTGGTNSKINSKNNSLWYNYTSSSLGFETIKDTIRNIVDEKGITTIPLYFSGGIGIGKNNKWNIGVDVSMQDWSKYESFNTNDSLQNSYSIAAGGEWIPSKNGLKYFQKVQYRFGAHYAKSYLQLRNTDIKDYGVSFGFGLPIINKDRIQKAMIQLGFEAGQRGTTENDLLQQQYLRFHLGITMNESWFFKRKYD